MMHDILEACRRFAATLTRPRQPTKDRTWWHVVRFFNKGTLPPDLPAARVEQLRAMREIYVRGLWEVAGAPREPWEAAGVSDPRLVAELVRLGIGPEQLCRPVPETLRARYLLRGRRVGALVGEALVREELDVDEAVDHGLLEPSQDLGEQLLLPLGPK